MQTLFFWNYDFKSVNLKYMVLRLISRIVRFGLTVVLVKILG